MKKRELSHFKTDVFAAAAVAVVDAKAPYYIGKGDRHFRAHGGTMCLKVVFSH